MFGNFVSFIVNIFTEMMYYISIHITKAFLVALVLRIDSIYTGSFLLLNIRIISYIDQAFLLNNKEIINSSKLI